MTLRPLIMIMIIFLIGVQDFMRQGALRFRLEGNEEFLGAGHEKRAPCGALFFVCRSLQRTTFIASLVAPLYVYKVSEPFLMSPFASKAIVPVTPW